jgi:hypothetical protein
MIEQPQDTEEVRKQRYTAKVTEYDDSFCVHVYDGITRVSGPAVWFTDYNEFSNAREDAENYAMQFNDAWVIIEQLVEAKNG